MHKLIVGLKSVAAIEASDLGDFLSSQNSSSGYTMEMNTFFLLSILIKTKKNRIIDENSTCIHAS